MLKLLGSILKQSDFSSIKVLSMAGLHIGSNVSALIYLPNLALLNLKMAKGNDVLALLLELKLNSLQFLNIADVYIGNSIFR